MLLFINIVLLVVACYFMWKDHSESKRDVYYGLTESNKLWRNRYGFYSPGKWMVVGPLVYGLFIGLLFIKGVSDYAFSFYLPVIVGEFFILQRKKKNQSFARSRQIGILNSVKSDPEYYKNYPVLKVTSKEGLVFLSDFPWIKEKNTASSEVGLVLILQGKLLEDIADKSPGDYLLEKEKEKVF